MVQTIAVSLPEETLGDEVRVARAKAILAQLTGSLQLARIAASKPESDSILSAGIEAALMLAGLGLETSKSSGRRRSGAA